MKWKLYIVLYKLGLITFSELDCEYIMNDDCPEWFEEYLGGEFNRINS